MSGRPTADGERGGRFTGVSDDVAGQVALVGIAVTGRDLGHGQPAFLSVDGVVRGLGSPDEDRGGGFEHGG